DDRALRAGAPLPRGGPRQCAQRRHAVDLRIGIDRQPGAPFDADAGLRRDGARGVGLELVFVAKGRPEARITPPLGAASNREAASVGARFVAKGRPEARITPPLGAASNREAASVGAHYRRNSRPRRTRWPSSARPAANACP